MTASDAVYHKKCLTALHTRYRSFVRKKKEDGASENMKPESVALAEFISYLEEMKCTDGSHTPLKLSDLMKFYTECLAQLGGDTSKRINSTHIKDKLLAQLPQLEAHTCNREVVSSFKEDIGEALLHACKQSSNDDVITLMRAAQIVCKDILQRQYQFDGSLVDESYNNAPPSLTALMQMILAGTNIQKQTAINKGISVPVQSLTQLVTFKTVKRSRLKTAAVHHNVEHGTSLPLYLGLLIHSKTRKRDLVDVLFQHGLSVSYDCVLRVSTDKANRVIEIYEHDGVVCPTKLRGGLFTTGNLDNIDHNPSSVSARSSFHGTAISLTQHVSPDNCGTIRYHENVTESEKKQRPKTITALPVSYSEIPPAAFEMSSRRSKRD